MAVDHDIHLILLEDTQVHMAQNGDRVSEEDVLKFGGDHRTAPPIGQGASGRLQEDIAVVLIHAHVGSVHDLHDLPIDSSGCRSDLPPEFLPFEGRPLEEEELSLLTTELGQGGFPHVDGNILHGPIPDLHTEVHGHLIEFLLILDFEVGDLSLGGGQKEFRHSSCMIRVGRGPCSHHPGEVPCGYGLRGGAAYASPFPLLLRCFPLLLLGGGDPAGSHGTNPTTASFRADGAGLHLLRPLKNNLASIGLCLLDQRKGSLINALGSLFRH